MSRCAVKTGPVLSTATSVTVAGLLHILRIPNKDVILRSWNCRSCASAFQPRPDNFTFHLLLPCSWSHLSFFCIVLHRQFDILVSSKTNHYATTTYINNNQPVSWVEAPCRESPVYFPGPPNNPSVSALRAFIPIDCVSLRRRGSTRGRIWFRMFAHFLCTG